MALAPELTAFLHALPVAAMVTDLTGVPLEWNRIASALLHVPSGRAHTEGPRITQGEPRWFQRLRAEALTGEGPAAALLSSRRDGSARFLRVHAGALLDPNGSGPCLLFTLLDVTRRVAAKRRTADSESRFESLARNAPVAIGIQQNERVVFANEALARLLGASHAEELGGRSIYDLVHPDWRDLIRQRVRQICAGQYPDGNEDRLLRFDGTPLDVETLAFPVLHRGEAAVLVILRDAAERKRIETSLRVSKERFRLLTEGVRDHAIMMLDPDGCIVSWNTGAERLTGYPAHQAVRKHVATVMRAGDEADFDAAADHLRRAADDGRTEYQAWRVRRNGTRFWAHVVITALYDPDRRIVGFAKIVRDLTERREAEEALRRSEEHLRQAQKMEAVGRLAGGIAHDFNNLLTAIQGHAQFLLEDLPETGSSHGDALEIKRAADRAASLTRQLLIFSRKQVLQPLLMDVNLVVRDMHTLLRRVIREDIELETDLVGELWPIRADPSQLEQVLMNLAVNARDAMPRGGKLTVRTRNVTLDQEGDLGGIALPAGRYVQLLVSDTGMGMDRPTQARIFEPFFTTKAEGEGTGLGLAIVYGIVRQLGGAISVYSEPGQGTTFKLVFPSGEADVVRTAQLAPEELARGWESVLVVEDDPAIRSHTSRALQGRGYSVLEAESGREALRLAEEYDGPIDLVITDIVMPEMSGRKLAESLRAVHPAARVLFMSGFTMDEVVRQGLVDADAKFIEKPFTSDYLARKVREVLDEP
jgi:PAS domain S-box-containing protein